MSAGVGEGVEVMDFTVLRVLTARRLSVRSAKEVADALIRSAHAQRKW